MAFVRKVLDTTEDNAKRIVKVGQRVLDVGLKTDKIIKKAEKTAKMLKHQVRACRRCNVARVNPRVHPCPRQLQRRRAGLGCILLPVTAARGDVRCIPPPLDSLPPLKKPNASATPAARPMRAACSCAFLMACAIITPALSFLEKWTN